MSLLVGLNPEQLHAVKHDTGPMLVVAGAGTGKTQVITRRIAYLIQEKRARPSEILALTFTEKAAREMGERLHSLIGWEAFQVPFMTFNAFGAELLTRYGMHIGRGTRGGLINTTQKSLLLKQHFSADRLQYYNVVNDVFGFMEGMVERFDKLQNAGISAGEYSGYVSSLTPSEQLHSNDISERRDIATLYSLYEQIKEKTQTYDYYDQLALPLRILRERPNLALRLQNEYKYVLVDEYQDTSPVQDALLRTFIPPSGNIFAVGDDDQAIYSFRGADISNILAFADHFSVAEPLALVQNYRSGQPVLDAAYSLICRNNPDRLEAKLHISKRLKAQSSSAIVKFTPFRTRTDEYHEVLEELERRLAAGATPSSIAVLARSNNALKLFGKGMRERDLPFALSTEVNIFEQKELIHLWYLMQWLAGIATNEHCLHVAMGPFMSLSPDACRGISRRAKTDLSSFEDALVIVADEGNEAAREVIDRLELWRRWAQDEGASRLAYRLFFDTGLVHRLASDETGRRNALQVFEDLRRLLEHMSDFESVAVDRSLHGYLEAFPKPPALEVSETLGEEEGVKLLTIHASKGLEFETVFVIGCTQRAWSEMPEKDSVVPPELKASNLLPPIHEQRRLMYVAATRAKRELYLSAPLESEGGQKQVLSQLVYELVGGDIVLPVFSKEKKDDEQVLMQKLQRFYPLKEHSSAWVYPYESTDGWITLAVGALYLYDKCPHEFYLQHALGLTQAAGPHVSLGTSIHGVIQTYNEHRLRGEDCTLEVLLQRLDELWSNNGYETAQLAAYSRARAENMLSAFYRREQELKREVLGSEMKIHLELSEAKLRIRGRIDAFYRTPDGIEIRDFKTGNKSDPERLQADAKDNFQLRTYAVAYEAMTGIRPGKVTLDYVMTGVEGSAVLTERILSNHRSKLVKLAERIRARDFAPAPLSEFHRCAAYKYYGEEDENKG